MLIYAAINLLFTLINADYGIKQNEILPKVEGQDILTWCTTSGPEQQKCDKLAKTVMLDKGLFGRDYIELACRKAFDAEECMDLVDKRYASLVALDPGEVYIAGRYHSLVPIMQELYGHGEPFQYAVAVVKKGTLPGVNTNTGLRGLRGAKACFPGVGTLAGWLMPIHILMQEGDLKITDCNNHVKSATQYFGESCAPNSLKDMYNPIGDNSDKLCRLCAGGPGVRCTLADPHADYTGALRCLAAEGDVAFVRDTTVHHMLHGGLSENNLELLCRDGSRKPVSNWEKCNWGKVPANAIVTSSAVMPADRERYQNFLQKLVQLYGEPNPYNTFQNKSYVTSTARPRYMYDAYNRDNYNYEQDKNKGSDRVSTLPPYQPRTDVSGQPIELPFKLFMSNGSHDLLVQDATVNFHMLSEEEQNAQHIMRNERAGDAAARAVAGVRACPVRRAALCLTSQPEMDKCIKMKIATRAGGLAPRLECRLAHSSRACSRAVAAGDADFVVLDAADMLHAAQHHKLVPFMQEVYSSGDNWYYAVAVAKEQDPDTDLTYLRNKNTCHTGMGTAAGWVYPLAYLLSNGWIRPYACDGAYAAAEYFSKACVPGALSAEYVDADTVPHDNLCHLCHGASFRRCRRDAAEEYYGETGALRCMVEGGGHVAFVGHTAPHAVVGGRRREFWARDLLPDDLQLLCPDGTRASINEYARCNLGRVDGAVLVGRANHTELDAYAGLLLYAQRLYGATATDEFSFSMFHSPPPYADLIFSDAAVRLKSLPRHRRSAALVASPALLRASRLVSCDAPRDWAAVAADPEFLAGASTNQIAASLLPAVMAFLLW